MHISEFYKEIYKRFDSVTPLYVDCGKLCDKLCCRGDDESGMYLFPGEARLFSDNKNFSVLPTELSVKGKEVKLLVCHGPCTRMDRPLACRIFPLFPYYTRKEGLKIITDPRAALCPLSHPSAAPYIRSDFKKRIEKTFRFLIRFPEIADYLEVVSESFRDFERLKGSF